MSPKRMNKSPIPALEPLESLVGKWNLTVSNAAFLGEPEATMDSPCSIQWIQGGHYLLMTQGDEGAEQLAHWMMGRDDDEDEYRIFYADGRGVSRVYSMTLDGGEWKIWRAASGFHQRFNARLSEDGQRIRGRWESSEDGKEWQHDFDLTYQRIETK